jgi:hypothetical protein
MKKKHIYIAVPLLALVLFAAYYWNFSIGYDHHQDEIAAQARRERDEAIREQNRQREKAVQMALAEQDKRKQDRLAKEAEETKRKDERQAAYQARDQAALTLAQNRDKAERLEKEVAVTKEQIAKIEQDEKFLRADKTNIEEYVRKAQENVRDLTAVLDKIAKADAANIAARAAAAAAAARAKKS